MQKSGKMAIVGLGQMGTRIAELFISKNYQVTVWNRTLSKASGIKGASIANNITDAIKENPIIIICVYDNKAVQQILESITDKIVFENKVVINFTTGSPAEVSQLESLINSRKGHYLNGAIQVAPDQMGLPDTTILLAGNKEAHSASKDILAVMGGNVKYLSDNAAASSAMDLATLTWVYGSYIGLLYGVALAQSAGLKLEAYRDIIGEIAPGFTEFYKHEINVIDQNNFQITQSPLSISVSATQRISDAIGAIGADTAFPLVMSDMLKKANEKGLADLELAVLIKIIQNDNAD